jgi:sugar phosphate isomerase/epimerase
MTLTLHHGDLVLSHFSLPRDTGISDRVQAASLAGFQGFGWFVGDYVKHRSSGWTDQQLLNLFAENNLVLHEIDALPLNRLEHLDAAIHMAQVFQPHHVQVQGDYPDTFEDAAAEIKKIAQMARQHNVRVAIEFVGDKNIRTAKDALRLTHLSGEENVGVQVDIWHHIRGANDWSMIEELPHELVYSVQFDDGPKQPRSTNYTEDTIRYRSLPGEGEFDITRFLNLVYGANIDLPLSVEVISDDLLAIPVSESARLMAETTRNVLSLHNQSKE